MVTKFMQYREDVRSLGRGMRSVPPKAMCICGHLGENHSRPGEFAKDEHPIECIAVTSQGPLGEIYCDCMEFTHA